MGIRSLRPPWPSLLSLAYTRSQAHFTSGCRLRAAFSRAIRPRHRMFAVPGAHPAHKLRKRMSPIKRCLSGVMMRLDGVKESGDPSRYAKTTGSCTNQKQPRPTRRDSRRVNNLNSNQPHPPPRSGLVQHPGSGAGPAGKTMTHGGSRGIDLSHQAEARGFCFACLAS